jgi:mevalonate kinase
MPAISDTAPGKAILFGEHAVVYGQPAIAVPVSEVSAKAIINADILGPPGRVHIESAAIGMDADLDALKDGDPIAKAIQLTIQTLKIERVPAFKLKISSSIPVASGLGSGAAVSVAVIGALSSFLGQPLADEEISELAFEIEKLHHGSPSGIDNSVVAFEQPVYFQKGKPMQSFKVGKAFQLVIGDTGISSPTGNVVADVRKAWEREPAKYEEIFRAIGGISEKAFEAIKDGKVETLGELMGENHRYLQVLGVSSMQLDTMVEAAMAAGAMGAKLSGGGRGGSMIAVVSEESSRAVAKALMDAGATNTIETRVE